jgi:hypothetical protein
MFIYFFFKNNIINKFNISFLEIEDKFLVDKNNVNINTKDIKTTLLK